MTPLRFAEARPLVILRLAQRVAEILKVRRRGLESREVDQGTGLCEAQEMSSQAKRKGRACASARPLVVGTSTDSSSVHDHPMHI